MGDDSEGKTAQQRRIKFSSEQIGELEAAFRYLRAAQRRRMAEKLKLSETQVGQSARVRKLSFS